MVNQNIENKYKIEKCKSGIAGIPGFIIKDKENDEPLSRISVIYTESSEYKGYVVFKSKMPANNMTSDDFLGVLVLPRSCKSLDDIRIYEQIEVKEAVLNSLERELEALHEKSNSPFDVSSYLGHLGFNSQSKGVYPGMRNLLLDDLVRHSPEYAKDVERYKSTQPVLVSTGSEE